MRREDATHIVDFILNSLLKLGPFKHAMEKYSPEGQQRIHAALVAVVMRNGRRRRETGTWQKSEGDK